MKVGYFTERPARWVPEEAILRNGGHFGVSNSYFDREKRPKTTTISSTRIYMPRNWASTSFALNEHHGTRSAWAA